MKNGVSNRISISKRENMRYNKKTDTYTGHVEKHCLPFYPKTKIQYHMNRSIQVEGIFGVLKHAKIQKTVGQSSFFTQRNCLKIRKTEALLKYVKNPKGDLK